MRAGEGNRQAQARTRGCPRVGLGAARQHNCRWDLCVFKCLRSSGAGYGLRNAWRAYPFEIRNSAFDIRNNCEDMFVDLVCMLQVFTSVIPVTSVTSVT